MRPINLLPPYIYDKQKKVQLAAFWGVAALAVVGGFIYWQTLIGQELTAAQNEKTTAEQHKTEYDRQVSLINAEDQKIADIKQKQTFIANAQQYNDQWAEGYSLMRDVTSPDVILRTIRIEPNTRKVISFAGAARREMDIIKWWMALRNDQERFESVRFELPPHPYTPGGNTAAAGTAGSGLAGGPRGFGGFGGPGSGGMGSGGPGMAPRGMSGPGGVASMSMATPGGGPGSGGGFSGFGGGARGFGGGGGAQGGEVGPAILEGRPVINFVATAVLKKGLAEGIALPSWPPGAAGGTTGGGGFGGSFGPGGSPGGPMPGGPPGMPGSMGGGAGPGGPRMAD